MSWRLARSLDVLRTQVNIAWPNRNKENDGTIGDEAHASRASDHNPNNADVVQAMDITHDPARGFNSYKFADLLKSIGDNRIKYVISNSRIWNPSVSSDWRAYHGSNPHDHHVHISVSDNPRLYDDTRSWQISGAVVPPIVVPPPAPLPPPRPGVFDECLKLLLVHEGGNDDDERDAGGRTSRGITQTEWNKWRSTHSGLPSDVFDAPQSQVAAIYRQNYWDVLSCDDLSPGIDYCVFDFGVNSGVDKAAKLLQSIVKAGIDGHIGPITLAQTRKMEASSLVSVYSSERMEYLKGNRASLIGRPASSFAVYGTGWGNRVSDVRRDASAMVALSAANPPAPLPPSSSPHSGASLPSVGAVGVTSGWLARLRALFA